MGTATQERCPSRVLHTRRSTLSLRSLVLTSTLALASMLALGERASAQSPPATGPIATARGLEALASDGSVVHVGEVTGRITLSPARARSARFGRLRVHAGLDFYARARPGSELPAYVVGALADILHVADESREARLDALHRVGRALHARIVLGDTTLEDVPLQMASVLVEGPPPYAHSVSWSPGAVAVREGTTRLCSAPGSDCVTMRNEATLFVSELERRRGWSRVRAEATGLRLEGWIPTRALVTDILAVGHGRAGQPGSLSDGCPYQGEPALVAAGTPVRVAPGGPIWAHIPDAPDSVWVHDARPGSPWVELTLATGVQRDFPGATCSTGWIPRASVTWRDRPAYASPP